ncbi:MAG: hypothetical protein ACR2MX_17710 [Cyclobacteriaceae bacterium]
MRNIILLLAFVIASTSGIVYGQEVAEQSEVEMSNDGATDTLEVPDSLAQEPAKPLTKEEQKIAEYEALAAEAQAEADMLSEKAKSSPDPEAYHEVTKASLQVQKYQEKANQIKLKLQTAQRAEALKQQRADKKAAKKEKKKE